MKRKWRSAVLNTLRKKKQLTDTCKVTAIKGCGTVKTACGKTLSSGITATQFESLHSF
tara:strand:- start:377 stop:550 length:174 start_codon:yes stop_codon:yes gene_type:complete